MKTITNENEFFISSKKKNKSEFNAICILCFFAFTSDFDSVIVFD